MKKGYIVAGNIAASVLGYSKFENSKTINDLQSKIEYLEDRNNTLYSYNVSNSVESTEYTFDSFVDDNIEPIEEKKIEYVPISLAALKDDNTYTSTVKSFKIENGVYTTNTGSKYHRKGCRYLKYSSTEISMDQAISMGLTPCKVCRP